MPTWTATRSRALILTMIYRLCPTLIREGYVYIAESPLYEIGCKDKTWFAYTEQEKSAILKELDGKRRPFSARRASVRMTRR